MAQPQWRRLTLEVPSRDAEVASALLGAVTGEHVAIQQREGARAVAASAYARARRAPRILRELRARLRELQRDGMLRGASVVHAPVRDENWQESWKRYFRPFRVAAGMYIVPSWELGFQAERGAQTLLLDPGMAFGTGRHATTRLALRSMLPLVARGAVVIDAGCGSGILGIAAALRGASVYAFDEDPLALTASRVNFKRNGVRAARIARADWIPSKFPRADLIVANITGETLEDLAPNLAAHLKSGGRLVTSGITARNRLATLFALARAGLVFVEERRSGEWFAYVHQMVRTA